MNPVQHTSYGINLQNEVFQPAEKSLFTLSLPSSSPTVEQKNSSSDQNLISRENRRLDWIRSVRHDSEGIAGAAYNIASSVGSLMLGAFTCPDSLFKNIQNAKPELNQSVNCIARELGRYTERMNSLLHLDAARFQRLARAAEAQESSLNAAITACEEGLRNVNAVQYPALYEAYQEERTNLRDAASKIELAGIVRSHSVVFARSGAESITGLIGAAACFGSGILALASRNLFVSGILGGLSSGGLQVALQLLAHEGRGAFHTREDWNKLAQAMVVGAICGVVGTSVGRFFSPSASRTGLQIALTQAADVLTEVLADDAVSKLFSGQRNISNRLGLHTEAQAPQNEQRFGWKLFNNWAGEILGDRWNDGIHHRFIAHGRLDIAGRIQEQRQREALNQSLALYINSETPSTPSQVFNPYLAAVNTNNYFDPNTEAANDNDIPWGQTNRQVSVPEQQYLLQANGVPILISNGNHTHNNFRMSSDAAASNVVEVQSSAVSEYRRRERPSDPAIRRIPENGYHAKITNNLQNGLRNMPAEFEVFHEIANCADPLDELRLFLTGQRGREPLHAEVQALLSFVNGGAHMMSLVSSIRIQETETANFIEQVSFHQVYTKEFLDCLAANIILFAEDFKAKTGRFPLIRDVSFRQSGLAQALNRRLPADFQVSSLAMHASFEEADIFLSSWMPLATKRDVELAEHISNNSQKLWIDITSSEMNHSDEFWKRSKELCLTQNLMSSVQSKLSSPIPGLCFSFQGVAEGKETSCVLLHRSRNSRIPNAELKEIQAAHRIHSTNSSPNTDEQAARVRALRGEYYRQRQTLTAIDPQALEVWAQRYFAEQSFLFNSRSEASQFLTESFFSNQDRDKQWWNNFLNQANSDELLIMLQLLCGHKGFVAAPAAEMPRLYALLHQAGLKGLAQELGLFYVNENPKGTPHAQVILSLGFNGDRDTDYIYEHYKTKMVDISITGLAHTHKMRTGVQNALPSVVYERGKVSAYEGDLGSLFNVFRELAGRNIQGKGAFVYNFEKLNRMSAADFALEMEIINASISYNIPRSVTSDYGTSLYVLRMRNRECVIDLYTALKDDARAEDLEAFYARIKETYEWAAKLGITLRVYEYPKELRIVETFACPRMQGEKKDFPNKILVGNELIDHPLSSAYVATSGAIFKEVEK